MRRPAVVDYESAARIRYLSWPAHIAFTPSLYHLYKPVCLKQLIFILNTYV